MPYIPPSLRKKKEEEKKKSQSAWKLKGTQSYSDWMKIKKVQKEREEREAEGRKQLLLARFPTLPTSKTQAKPSMPALSQPSTNYLKTAIEPKKVSKKECRPSDEYEGPRWSCNRTTVFPVIFSPTLRTKITTKDIVSIESCTTTPGYIDPYDIDMMYDEMTREVHDCENESDIE